MQLLPFTLAEIMSKPAPKLPFPSVMPHLSKFCINEIRTTVGLGWGWPVSVHPSDAILVVALGAAIVEDGLAAGFAARSIV